MKWPCATVFSLFGLAGALAGAQVAKQVDGKALLTWFAVAMIAIALSMLLPRRNQGDPGVHLSPAMVLKLAPVGLFTGLAAGFFGIGGGFLIAPIVSGLLSVVLFKEALTVPRLVGSGLSVAGAYVLMAPEAGIELGSIFALAGGAPVAYAS